MVVVVMRVHDAEGVGRQAREAARLLRRAGRGPGASRSPAGARSTTTSIPTSRRDGGGVEGGAGLGLDGDGRRASSCGRCSTAATRRPERSWAGGSGSRRRGGSTATFSAPKSVSVLWALTPDPWVRAEVLAAHDAAVDAALGWFEPHGAVTRRGTDGVHQVDTLGVTAALFRQHTSRTVDPQLHTHAIVAAKVQDPTGRWLSLDARFLK